MVESYGYGKDKRGGGENQQYVSEDIEEMSWIQWFCGLEGHEFFASVDAEYIKDAFNLYGINTKYNITNYSDCLKLILTKNYAAQLANMYDQRFIELNRNAAELYGLIHVRYIMAQQGMHKMLEKYLESHFGTCPRALCENQNVLPVGMSDELKKSRVKIFCPKCCEVYIPIGGPINIDGAYFGTSFPHTFLQMYPNLDSKFPKTEYLPKVYGFQIYGKKGSKYYKDKEK